MRESFIDKVSGIVFGWQVKTNTYEPVAYDSFYDETTQSWLSKEIKKGDIFYDYILYIRHSSQNTCPVTGKITWGGLDIYQWAISFKSITSVIRMNGEDLLVAISRQAGKTFVARKIISFLTVFAGKHIQIPEDRFYTIFVAVKNDMLADQCGKLYPQIEAAVEFFNNRYPKTPLIKGVPYTKVKLVLDIDINGKQIPYAAFDGISAGASSNAGYTAHLITTDEAQLVDIDSFNEQIRPFTTRTGGCLLGIGTTVSSPDNLLFDMYLDPSIPSSRKVLYTCEDVFKYKALNSQSMADKYWISVDKGIKKYGLASDYVQAQYYVSFNIVGDKFITKERLRSGNVMTAEGGRHLLENTKDNFIVGGFDLAVANDYAVLSLAESTCKIGEGKNRYEYKAESIKTTLREVIILNKDRSRIGIDELIDKVCKYCKEHKVDMLMVDATAGQEHASLFLIKKLRELGIGTMVIPFSFANRNKVSMLTYLEQSLFNQTLILPMESYGEENEDYSEFLEELCYLKKTKKDSGGLQFKAPTGENFFDDCPMSVAMTNYCLYYSVINENKKLIELSSDVIYRLEPTKYASMDGKKRELKRVGRY